MPESVTAPREDVGQYDFSGLSDLDLVVMQRQIRELGEDKEFLNALLVELGNRQRLHGAHDHVEEDDDDGG